MAFPRKLNFTAVSTALLLSIVALPVSLMAFAISYVSEDAFWSVLWMLTVLPTIWVAVAALSIRDAVKWRSRRQIAGTVLLLAPTVLLFSLMLSPRFTFHRLFTFRSSDLQLPTRGFALIQKFSVCTQEVNCTSRSAVTETKAFRLTKVPDGCCSLQVINGRGDKHKVDTVRIVLNGKELNFASGGLLQMAPVRLSSENELTVQLIGTADAYIYVVIRYTGKKVLPN